jgi:CRISPR-associated protein Cas1
LGTTNEQLVIEDRSTGEINKVPIEDLMLVILEEHQVTISVACLAKLASYGVGVIYCDETHHPNNVSIPYFGHSLQGKIVAAQLKNQNANAPVLWQQLVKAKLANQAMALKKVGQNYLHLQKLSEKVKPMDETHLEAQGARKYFSPLFGEDFSRDPEGGWPNNWLNYTYSILRALAAKSITMSGLIGYVGLFHRNQYNHWPLADDVMEPYRPVADLIVYRLWQNYQGEYGIKSLSPTIKKALLGVITTDVMMEGKQRPLYLAMQDTCTSLQQVLMEQNSQLRLPNLCQ